MRTFLHAMVENHKIIAVNDKDKIPLTNGAIKN